MTLLRPTLPLLVMLALFGCGEDERLQVGDGEWVPPPESCATPDLDRVDQFTPCSTASGIFGRWTHDDLGLPAYDYHLDENADARASYPVSERDTEGEPIDRRDHWAAFGNQRLDALFVNDGYIEVTTEDRGVEYLNKFDRETGAYAGGFSYLSDGAETWCTAYAWRPAGARTTRRFGMGYAESSMDYRGVRELRRTTAPAGDSAVLVSDVTLRNLEDSPKHLSRWEYWDVGRRPIEINWIVSGEVFKEAPKTARATRDGRNALFDETASWDPALERLSLRRSYAGDVPRPDRDAPSATDYWPNEPFLAAPFGGVSDLAIDQASFFGGGGVAHPDVPTSGQPGEGVAAKTFSTRNGLGQPLIFALKQEIDLAPGEDKTLRFVYGYAPSGEPYPSDPAWSDPSWDPRREYVDALGGKLFYFAEKSAPVLQRELAWHAYQMEASVAHRDYWQGRVVPQGSAYLYLHGADGAARDLGLFALPLVYTDPALAKDELRLYMGIQYADGRFSYAFQGHGKLDDASIHTAPSDLPIFFALALGEYLGATGDLGFLDEHAAYWPREADPDATVMDHLIGALRQLFDVVGTGEHGLIRIGTGDWSDGIVSEAPDRTLAVEKGESVPNTQMAVAVLPRIADLIENREPALAQEIRDHVDGYRAALGQTWNGSFFYRCYFGDGKPRYDKTINLESQVWALIGESFATAGDREKLIDAIATKLDDPSPIGATLTPGSQVWPAISALLTWGYARSDPARAWGHFTRNTMAAHALAFPEDWYGIWSGPDGVSSNSGWAWSSQVTPMTDFPVQNNNYHAMPMLAALRIAGIEASAEGLAIAPAIPSRSFTLKTALLDLEERSHTLSGVYRPSGAEARVVRVVAHTGEHVVSATENGNVLEVPTGSTSVSFHVDPAKETSLAFELVTEK
jgi:Glycosyl hydrolase 36 superfamily, catalytic domain/Glycosyltransferase family 36